MDPCEIRIRKPREKDMEFWHPFLFYKIIFKEINLIGDEYEIRASERLMESFFLSLR